LRSEGISAVYGDASHADILDGAGIAKATGLILSAAGMRESREIIKQARELNPAIQILARSAYVHELATLRQAGAENVYSDEGEVALAFTVAILGALGATAEQMDRQRERVHAELLGRTRTR
jgi:CPA2 family monovalent cation:H+ antiporter-2